MVKKQKEETPNVNATANRDIVQRLNFLYQASSYLQSAALTPFAQQKGKARQIEEILDEDDRDNPMVVDGPSTQETSNHITEPTKTKQGERSIQKTLATLRVPISKACALLGRRLR